MASSELTEYIAFFHAGCKLLVAQINEYADMRKNFKDDELQIIIPKKRINFLKKLDGKEPENWGNRCNFDCLYYCYKMNFPKDIIWLD